MLIFLATSSETLELAPSVSTSADSQTNKPFNFSFAAASTLPAVSNSQLNLPSLLPQQPLLPGVQSTNIDGVVSGSKLETQSPVKRASVGDSNFPQFFRKPSETQNTANESSLAHQSNTSELSQASLTNLSSQSPPIPQINSGSLKQQTQLPDAEAEPVDTEKLLEHLCRVGLVQKDGILDMFVSLQVSKIVQDVFQTFQKRRFAQKLCRSNYLESVHFADRNSCTEDSNFEKEVFHAVETACRSTKNEKTRGQKKKDANR